MQATKRGTQPTKTSTKRLAQLRHKHAETFARYRARFAVESTPLLDTFEPLLELPADMFEVSAKIIDDETLSASRFTIFFHDNISQAAGYFVDFIEKVARLKHARLDLDVANAIFHGLNHQAINEIAFGIDQRVNDTESAIKLYVAFNEPSKLSELVTLHGYDDDLLALITSHRMIAGVDISLRGITRLKFYLNVTPADLENIASRSRLERVLHPEVFKHNQGTFCIGFGMDGERLVGYTLRDGKWPQFIRNPAGQHYDSHCAALHLRLIGITVRESAFTTKKFHAVNAYYHGDYCRCVGCGLATQNS